jgi:hypothetical protein
MTMRTTITKALASTALGLVLVGGASELAGAQPMPQTREHVLLARQVGVTEEPTAAHVNLRWERLRVPFADDGADTPTPLVASARDANLFS